MHPEHAAQDPSLNPKLGPSVLDRFDPLIVALVLIILMLANGVVLTWRYLSLTDRPASTYYEYQVQRWEKQLAASPDDPAILATLGGLYESTGDDERAARTFKRALELDSSNVAALVYLSRSDRDAGNVDQARSRLMTAVKGLPEGGKYLVYYELGELERENGNTSAAIAQYEASQKDNGASWNAPYRLAFLYDERGDKDLALGAALSALRFAPDQTDLQDLAAKLKSEGVTATVEPTGMNVNGDAQ